MTAPAVGAYPLSGTSSSEAAPWTFIGLAGATVLSVAVFGIDAFLTVVAVALQLLFFLFAFRHVSFAHSATRSAPGDLEAPLPDTGYRPTVTVLVPCRNEELVVDRLMDALLRLDYPPDRIDFVIVNDGSIDRTGELLARRAASVDRVQIVNRPIGAGGGKSGALNAGLPAVTGEIVVVFDADHTPRPDVVLRLVRHFVDPVVGAVQGRCIIRNPGDTPLTHLIAIDYQAGYLVNEYGRQSLYQLPAYGGANCAVRTSSLHGIGGWNPETVTEDTDLTLRLVLSGQVVRYDVTAVDEEEGVVTFTRYWRQRYRWARGHQKVWRDYWRSVLRTDHLTRPQKLETLMFLLVFHTPVYSAAGLMLLVLWLAGVPHTVDPLHAFTFWTLLFLGPLVELGGGLLVGRADRRSALMIALFLPLFFMFLVLCTRAWVDGVLGRPYEWVKTKRAVEGSRPVAA